MAGASHSLCGSGRWRGSSSRHTEHFGLRFEHHPDGSLTQIVVDVDGESFSDAWIEAVEAAQKDG